MMPTDNLYRGRVMSNTKNQKVLGKYKTYRMANKQIIIDFFVYTDIETNKEVDAMLYQASSECDSSFPTPLFRFKSKDCDQYEIWLNGLPYTLSRETARKMWKALRDNNFFLVSTYETFATGDEGENPQDYIKSVFHTT